MKIAILGTRGVPPAYGGFETFAAELGRRLVQRGHDVSVYCRGAGAATWEGIHRIELPAIGHKYLETVSHAMLSALDSLRRGFDVVLVCNAANAFALPLLRAARIPVAINVDGIERKRRKWNALGQAVYAIGETMSVGFANAVIADAAVIARYYREQYAFEPWMIPYGADFPEEEDSDVLRRLGLRSQEYLLYVSRFEPENNPLEVVNAYELAVGSWQLAVDSNRPPATANSQQPTANNTSAHCPLPTAHSTANGQRQTANAPLVMLGKGLYAPELVEELHRHASDRILFPGALYGRDYRTLQRNALVYVHGTEVGGTHPAMIEAMASGGVVLANDTPENREVGGDAVGYFRLRPAETLSGMLSELLADAGKRQELRQRARQRAADRYNWDAVTDAYERLFRSIAQVG